MVGMIDLKAQYDPLRPEIDAAENDDLEIADEKIINKNTGKSFSIVPLPKSRQAILEAGGLIAYTRQRLGQGSAVK